MATKPSEETMRKLREGADRKTAERRQWREKPILAIAGWRIWRLDDYNICLAKDDADENYYRYFPTVKDACIDLLHQQISESDKGTVKGVLDTIHEAQTSIVKALSKSLTTRGNAL